LLLLPLLQQQLVSVWNATALVFPALKTLVSGLEYHSGERPFARLLVHCHFAWERNQRIQPPLSDLTVPVLVLVLVLVRDWSIHHSLVLVVLQGDPDQLVWVGSLSVQTWTSQ
jgi:hypothetical protein